MDVISHFNALTTIDAPWDEVRPITGAPIPALVQAIKDRYQFQTAGQSAASQQIGLTTPSFQGGQFKINDRAVPINQFEFQPAAVAVSSSTTDHTEAFAAEVLDFLHKTFGFRKPSNRRPRHHVTVIIVDFGESFAPLFGKINEIARVLVELGAPKLVPLSLRLGAVNADNQLLPAEASYVLEHRAITPPGVNWVYSQAPLDTAAHIKLLEKIESLVTG